MYTCMNMEREKIKNYLKKLGLAGFLFFLIKGLFWLFLFWGGYDYFFGK